MKDWIDFGIHIPPTARGPEVYTTCPQCSPHRKKASAKCLSANIEKLLWNCAHCGWAGTLKAGAERKSNPWEFVPKRYKKPEYKPEPLKDTTYAWFEKRGIPREVVERNKIFFGKVWMPAVEAEVDCIRFPVIRAGEVVNIKSRDGKKNFRQESGAERILYGVDDITADTMIIVEGELDKLSVEVAGFLNCVSVPDGAPSPKAKDYSSKFEFLESCEDLLNRMRKIILAVDNDEAGKVLEEELARRLGRDRCERVTWPEGCKDANEVLLAHGKDKLYECINLSRPYPISGVFEVTDIYVDILNLYQGGVKRGALVGWDSLDALYSVRLGEWTVVTGMPGSGKSEVLDAMLVKLAEREGWCFALFSPENFPVQRHAAKIAEKYIGKPFYENPVVPRMTSFDLQKAAKFLHKHFVFVAPEDHELTIDAVLGKIRQMVMRRGIRGAVIDPWNELDHQRPNGMSETEYISAAITKIRRFARECNIHIWLVAHPTKMQKDKQTGQYPVPTLYDISGSAHWRNKADNGLVVFRNIAEGAKEVEVHVQKIRFKEIGKVGMAQLHYHYSCGRYSDPSSPPKEEKKSCDDYDFPD